MLIRCNYCWLGLFKCLSAAFAFPRSGLCSSACLEASINTFWKGHLYNEDAHGLWPCLWWARHESALCNESLFITQGLMPHNPSDSYRRTEDPELRGSDCISHGKLQKHLKTLFLSHTPAEKITRYIYTTHFYLGCISDWNRKFNGSLAIGRGRD